MSREDKIVEFIRRVAHGREAVDAVNAGSRSAEQAALLNLIQTNQVLSPSTQTPRAQPMPNPSANLLQALPSHRSTMEIMHNSTPNHYPQMQQQQFLQDYLHHIVGIDCNSQPQQYVQYYPHEHYHDHYHDHYHPQQIPAPPESYPYPPGTYPAYPAQPYPMAVHTVGPHQGNQAVQTHQHAVTIGAATGQYLAQGNGAVMGYYPAESVRANYPGNAAGNNAVIISGNRPASESGIGNYGNYGNDGNASFTADESLRVNPEVRRTMSAGVANFAINQQGFWNRQNQPRTATDDNNNSNVDSIIDTSGVSRPGEKERPKKNDQPLQLENIYGELRQYVDNTTCAICTDLFEDPRILPCGHTFCFDCIEALITASANEQRQSMGQQSSDVICPVCRHNCSRLRDANNLTKNFTVKSLVETVRISAKNKASEKEMTKLANDLAALSPATKTRMKDLPKQTVAMARNFKVPQRITGLVQIGKKIYVVTEGSNKLLVFEKNAKKPESEIPMQGISQPKDIAGNEKLDFLLVVDASTLTICRVFVGGGNRKGDIDVFTRGVNEPFNIFLSPETLMVTKLDRKDQLLSTYRADPTQLKLVQKINLPPSLKHSLHAVQTPTGNFYISHKLEGEERGGGISLMDGNGDILLSLSGEWSFGGPFFYLALTNSGDIIASEGSLKALLKFDPQLKTPKLIWKLKEGAAPWKINYQRGVLAVGYESWCIQTFEI